MAIPSSVAVSHCAGLPLSAATPWRADLPLLHAGRAVLRELSMADAEPLAAALGNPDVLRYLPSGPTSVEHFTRFARWVRRERRAGRYVCFVVVPPAGTPSGLFQLWPIEPGFGTAEMGFALDPSLWGTGTFLSCATKVIDFAFEALGVRRLEFRSAVSNGRGTGALLKLGAVSEGRLRSCFASTSGVLDYTMWSILAEEWRGGRAAAGRSVR